MTNSRRRKDRSEFNRGFANGQGLRKLESNERSADFCGGPYRQGFIRGREIHAAKLERRKYLDWVDAEFQKGTIGSDQRNAAYGTANARSKAEPRTPEVKYLG